MNLIIEILKAIVLGVVEGITEWLPISSTGHMILVDEFLHLNVTPQFKEMFLVVIQLGAILAVVVLYWHKLWPFGIENKRIVPKKDIWQMWFKVLVSCVPAAVVGVLFDDKLNALFYNWQTVAIMLILFGVFFFGGGNLEQRQNRQDPFHWRVDLYFCADHWCFSVDCSCVPGHFPQRRYHFGCHSHWRVPYGGGRVHLLFGGAGDVR